MKIKMKLIGKLGSVKPLSNRTNTFDKEQGRPMYDQEQKSWWSRALTQPLVFIFVLFSLESDLVNIDDHHCTCLSLIPAPKCQSYNRDDLIDYSFWNKSHFNSDKILIFLRSILTGDEILNI